MSYKVENVKVEGITDLGMSYLKEHLALSDYVEKGEDFDALTHDYLLKINYNEELFTELVLYIKYNLETKETHLLLLADDDTDLHYEEDFLESLAPVMKKVIDKQTNYLRKLQTVLESLEKKLDFVNPAFIRKQTQVQDLFQLTHAVDDTISFQFHFADGEFLFYFVLFEGETIFMQRYDLDVTALKEKMESIKEFQEYKSECV